MLHSDWTAISVAACTKTCTRPSTNTQRSGYAQLIITYSLLVRLHVHVVSFKKLTNVNINTAELGWVCIPIAVETYGCWGTEAKWAISQLASCLATRQNCPKSASATALYQRLSMTLVRANVRALLSRAISDAGYSYIIYLGGR